MKSVHESLRMCERETVHCQVHRLCPHPGWGQVSQHCVLCNKLNEQDFECELQSYWNWQKVVSKSESGRKLFLKVKLTKIVASYFQMLEVELFEIQKTFLYHRVNLTEMDGELFSGWPIKVTRVVGVLFWIRCLLCCRARLGWTQPTWWWNWSVTTVRLLTAFHMNTSTSL